MIAVREGRSIWPPWEAASTFEIVVHLAEGSQVWQAERASRAGGLKRSGPAGGVGIAGDVLQSQAVARVDIGTGAVKVGDFQRVRAAGDRHAAVSKGRPLVRGECARAVECHAHAAEAGQVPVEDGAALGDREFRIAAGAAETGQGRQVDRTAGAVRLDLHVRAGARDRGEGMQIDLATLERLDFEKVVHVAEGSQVWEAERAPRAPGFERGGRVWVRITCEPR